MITHNTTNQHDVTLEFLPGDIYRVTYGDDITETINYHDACIALGAALMHAAACSGEFDE